MDIFLILKCLKQFSNNGEIGAPPSFKSYSWQALCCRRFATDVLVDAVLEPQTLLPKNRSTTVL